MRRYDLEMRTLRFAKEVRNFLKDIPKTIANREGGVQLHQSFRFGRCQYEANEAMSKKDFVYRIKTCRKEAKESTYWLQLIDTGDTQLLEDERKQLLQEATELMKIFASILHKSQ